MILTILSFLVVLGLCVLVHEWGHFVAARKSGVKVLVFSVGFGKALWQRKDKKGTVWKIGWMPLGGYVQMPTPTGKKMTKKQESELMETKKVWQKIWIASNGVIMNFILAFVLIFSVFFFKGIPQTPALIDQVVESSPAAKAGLKPGDIILKAGSKEVKKFEDLRQKIMMLRGQNIDLEIKRNDKILTLNLTPEMNENNIPMIGVTAQTSLDDLKKVGFIGAVSATGQEMYNSVGMMFKGLGQIFSGKRSAKELGGFISIAQMSGRAAESGFYTFLFFMAFISMNLGVINLFPIPGLDGGQLVFFFYEGIFRRPAPQIIQTGLTYIGFGLLIFLMGFSTLNDILRNI